MKKTILGLWALLTVAFLMFTSGGDASQSNILGTNIYILFVDQVLTAGPTNAVTSAAVPTGSSTDAFYELNIQNLPANQSVTITHLGISSTKVSAANHATFPSTTQNTLGYHVQFGISPTRVITENGGQIWPVTYPTGVESLKFVIESSHTGVAVDMVAGAQ